MAPQHLCLGSTRFLDTGRNQQPKEWIDLTDRGEIEMRLGAAWGKHGLDQSIVASTVTSSECQATQPMTR